MRYRPNQRIIVVKKVEQVNEKEKKKETLNKKKD